MPDTAPPADGAAITSSYLQTMMREQVVRTVTSSTRPTGVEGAVIYETDTDTFYYYSGSAWVGLLGLTTQTNFAHFREQQTSGTAGGSSTATTWTKRTLNTTVVNTITGCTLTSGVISLPAGTYYARGSSVLYITVASKTRLRDTTTPATLVVGRNHYDNSTGNGGTSFLTGQFTITGTKNIELQYYTATGTATNGLGVAVSSGEVEIYAELEIWRTA